MQEGITMKMNRDGFYPPHNCKKCGTLLGKVPAELYAGTYTGICYPCTGNGVILLSTSKIDGVKHYEFPPHCPSWRRDREVFYGYTGCAKCNGQGRIWVSRSSSGGGGYTMQCPECSDRYHGNPIRIQNENRNKRIGIAYKSAFVSFLVQEKFAFLKKPRNIESREFFDHKRNRLYVVLSDSELSEKMFSYQKRAVVLWEKTTARAQ
jgi:RecJ-like exonuclease